MNDEKTLNWLVNKFGHRSEPLKLMPGLKLLHTLAHSPGNWSDLSPPGYKKGWLAGYLTNYGEYFESMTVESWSMICALVPMADEAVILGVIEAPRIMADGQARRGHQTAERQVIQIEYREGRR